MASGLGTPIDGLPASPPHVSLLSSLTAKEMGDDTQWEGGIRWDPENCVLDFATDGDFPYWWDCPDDGGATAEATSSGGVKQVPQTRSIREYQPYIAHTGYVCRPTNNQRTDEIHRARATRALLSNLSRIIERELWEGTVATAASFPNDFFTNAPGTIVGLQGHVTALAELEQAIAGGQNGRGMIHAQPRVVSLWSRNGLVKPVPSVEGRRLVTDLGTIVVPGAGYTGSGTAGGAAGDINSSWAFATDMIRVLLSPVRVIPEQIAEAVDRAVNTAVYRAERTVAAFWDGCTKTGVQVDHDVELT